MTSSLIKLWLGLSVVVTIVIVLILAGDLNRGSLHEIQALVTLTAVLVNFQALHLVRRRAIRAKSIH